MTNTTTDQKLDACQMATDKWANQSSFPESRYGQSEGFSAGWQARGEYEAQQRPDLLAVREALSFYALAWFKQMGGGIEPGKRLIADKGNRAHEALIVLDALLATPQATPFTEAQIASVIGYGNPAAPVRPDRPARQLFIQRELVHDLDGITGEETLREPVHPETADVGSGWPRSFAPALSLEPRSKSTCTVAAPA